MVIGEYQDYRKKENLMSKPMFFKIFMMLPFTHNITRYLFLNIDYNKLKQILL